MLNTEKWANCQVKSQKSILEDSPVIIRLEASRGGFGGFWQPGGASQIASPPHRLYFVGQPRPGGCVCKPCANHPEVSLSRTLVMLLLLAIAVPASGGVDVYDRWFTGSTMRIDVYHTGTKGEEVISLDRVYREGDWPGSMVNLVDTLNLGEYLAQVYDRSSNQLIYSRGFSTMFNEWQTTDEALAGIRRSFSTTVRLPYPRREIQVVIAKRDKRMIFHELFSTVIDPASPAQVDREQRPVLFPVRALVQNGPPSKKVDILILGDGYTKAEMDKFRNDARRFNEVMFSTPPFSERKKDFNVWTIEVESRESGIDVPDKNLWKGNALGCSYNTFGSARYVLTESNRVLHDIAAAAPYDFICILVNDTRYGGGGIFNLYATTYTRELTKGQEWQMEYVYVHEFGHSFGGLGDEYYTSSTAYKDFYTPEAEPWEPNVTAMHDKGNLKWKAFLTAGVQLPTRWEKAKYDSVEGQIARFDRLAPDFYEKREPLHRAAMAILKNPQYADEVGAFEGAGYQSAGLYRPALDCRMFSLSLVGFDPVCSAAIGRMIDFYAR